MIFGGSGWKACAMMVMINDVQLQAELATIKAEFVG